MSEWAPKKGNAVLLGGSQFMEWNEMNWWSEKQQHKWSPKASHAAASPPALSLFCWPAVRHQKERKELSGRGVSASAGAEFTINKQIPSNQLKIDWWFVLIDSFSLTFIINEIKLFNFILFFSSFSNWAAVVFSLIKERDEQPTSILHFIQSICDWNEEWWVEWSGDWLLPFL